MRVPDYGVIGILTCLAGFIWLRDLSWLSAASDTLPILAGLPLFVWFRRPWTPTGESQRLNPCSICLAASLFLLGILTNSTLLLAAAWTIFLGSWVSCRFEGACDFSASKLLVLPFVSFPWLVNDCDRIGWWFRLSGATAAEKCFAWTPVSVTRHGTDLCVANFNLSVEPACSGLNGLQSMLIAGTILAFLKLKDTKLYWWNLPSLIAAAWLANTLRIIFAVFCGAIFSEATLRHWLQPLHLAAGWFALCAMFGLCWMMFEFEANLVAKLKNPGPKFGAGGIEKDPLVADNKAAPALENLDSSPIGSQLRHCEIASQVKADERSQYWQIMSRIAARNWAQKPWLEIFILGFCVWHCRGLVASWTSNPFDRMGWLAFAIWLAPILTFTSRNHVSSRSDIRKLSLMGAGLVLTFLGDIGELNFGEHLGLTLALASLAPARAVVPSIASASVWWPASGWLASHVSLIPSLFAIVRVLTALGFSLLIFRMTRRKHDTQNFDHAAEHQIHFRTELR